MPRDYYDVLGLKKGASDSEIKKSYRKLAREHHPDMVAETDKKEAEKRFKEINEAYQVLSDPEKKQMYDQFGHAGPGFAGNGGFNGAQGARGGQWGRHLHRRNRGTESANLGRVHRKHRLRRHPWRRDLEDRRRLGSALRRVALTIDGPVTQLVTAPP